MGIPTAPTAESDAWVVRRELHPDAPRLPDLVDDVEKFRSTDVYRNPLINPPARRRDPRVFTSTETLWADLLGRSIRRPKFRLVSGGVTAAARTVTRKARIGDHDLDDLGAPNKIIDGYRNVATVVLQGLHLSDPQLAKFANNLALQLDQPIQINAYLSPESARGLEVHFDYHDVFVVQLEGSKHWKIWPPTERTREPIGGKHRIPRPAPAELGEAAMDLVLEPGDVLYLPRGHPHVADTTDQPSAHLTVGLLAITWHRVVREAIDAEIRSGGLRASIPLSTLDPAREPSTVNGDVTGEPRAGSVEAGTPSLEHLNLDLTSLSLRRWVAQEIWRRQASTRLRPLYPHKPGTTEEWLTVTPGPLLALSRSGERSILFAGDRTISMPDEAHEFLAALLRTSGAFHRSELPGLDDGSARVVTTRLLDEGLLAPADGGQPS